ncbi:hypothetical protein WCD74_01645 [Actinomycetospora sp. OC33-EN08]|uniref:Uncharacterized protein n=1 Tax=Actinomycetospora aurantiaca TaxID=3129233 RepID=A0ABU8MGM6_9PSEU
MTAFGGVFRSPKLEGVEEGDESGQRAQVVGLDLESGVVRLRATKREAPEPTPDEADD